MIIKLMKNRKNIGELVGSLSDKLLLTLFGGLLLTNISFAGQMKDISVLSLPDDKVQIKFKFDSSVADPKVFTIDGEPVRVVFDFADVSNGLKQRNRDVGLGLATRITTVEAGGRTRAVVYLQDKAPYSVTNSGSEVSVVIGEKQSGMSISKASSGVASVSSGSSAKVAADSGEPMISNIDFRRGEAGEGRVIITLTDPSAAVDVRSEGGLLVADFADLKVPAKLQRRLDVMDFGTPVKTIDTMAKGNRTKITITPVSDFFEHMAYQSDNLLTIELRPLTRVEKEKIEAEKQVFEGERLTLNFQKIEVRAVLQIIAEFTGMNIVVSDSVSGSLTLRLENVPWDQALDIILKTKGLGMRQNGNVILVAPNTELAASEKAQLESKKQIEELAPLRSEYIQVNYAKAADLAGLLKSESGEGSMMSKRGSVTVDERTNLLLVRDTSQNLGQIRKLIEKLDIPVRQVLIESRIVVANDDFDKALGVKFGYA
ncbi:MAG: type IV pilus secretin family protein, partial [Gammaproteobacteria bacterium]